MALPRGTRPMANRIDQRFAMKHGLRRMALTTAALTALLLPLSAAPASAIPTGCSAGGGNTYATAWCSGGTGYYQVWATCAGTVWPYNWAFVQSGWKRVGTWGSAWTTCPPGFDGFVIQDRGWSRKN